MLRTARGPPGGSACQAMENPAAREEPLALGRGPCAASFAPLPRGRPEAKPGRELLHDSSVDTVDLVAGGEIPPPRVEESREDATVAVAWEVRFDAGGKAVVWRAWPIRRSRLRGSPGAGGESRGGT